MNPTTTAEPLAGPTKAESETSGRRPTVAAPKPPQPADVRLLAAGGTVLGLAAPQLVAWQLAAAAVWLAAAVGPRWLLGVAVAGAAGTAALTAVRGRGRWLYQSTGERIASGLRWRGRRRGLRQPVGDAELATARALLPELELGVIPGRRGGKIGVIRDGRGWVAAIGVHAGDEVLPVAAPVPEARLAAVPDARLAAVPVARLAAVLSGDDVRPAGVQVVLHLAPAAGPCPVPAARATWIVLRMDPSSHPSALAGPGGVDVLRHALRRAVERAGEILAAAGLTVDVLDDAGLRAALGLSSVAGTTTDRRAAGERRHGWLDTDAAHVGYWIRDWPADGVPALLGAAAGLPALAVSMSITLGGRHGRGVRMCGMLRITGRTVEEAQRAGTRLATQAAAAGGRLVRLDGQHAGALLATLPLGIGVR